MILYVWLTKICRKTAFKILSLYKLQCTCFQKTTTYAVLNATFPDTIYHCDSVEYKFEHSKQININTRCLWLFSLYIANKSMINLLIVITNDISAKNYFYGFLNRYEFFMITCISLVSIFLSTIGWMNIGLHKQSFN